MNTSLHEYGPRPENLHADIEHYLQSLFEYADKVVSIPNQDVRNLVRTITREEPEATDMHVFAKEFFETLVVFLEKKEIELGTDDVLIERFHDNIQELLFRQGTQYLSDLLDIPEKFAITARMTSVRQAQRWIGADMVKDLTNDIVNTREEDMEKIADSLVSLPPSTILNCIHLCETLATHASAQRKGESNPKGSLIAGRLKELIRLLHERDSRPLVGILSKIMNDRLTDLEEGMLIPQNFSLGRNAEQGRVSQRGPGKTFPLPSSLIRGKIQPIASDTIGLFDQSNRLVEIANIPRQEVKMGLDDNSIIHTKKTILGAARDIRGNYQSIFTVVKDQSLFPFKSDEHAAELLQLLHDPVFMGQTNRLIGINIVALPWRTQIHVLRCMLDKDPTTFEKLKTVLQKYPSDAENILISLFAVSEDPSFKDMILAMPDRQGSSEVLKSYANVVQKAETNAQELYELSKQMDPETKLTRQDFYRSLISRANSLLHEADECLWRDLDMTRGYFELQDILKEFDNESSEQAASRSFFLTQTSLLTQQKDVSLQECIHAQKFINNAFENSGAKKVLLRALERQGKLAHIPEIFWEVDRKEENYYRRLGLNMMEFLREFSSNSKKKTLVEFGPGNGTFAKQRSQDPVISKRYANLGICDKVYYPLAPVIKQLINWDAIQQDSGLNISPAEQDEFADFFYKVVVLEEGTTDLQYPEYDKKVRRGLDMDASMLEPYLKHKALLLGSTKKVPSVICGRDENGKVFYPHHLSRPHSRSLDAAFHLVSSQPEKYIHKDKNVYDLIPAYPTGVMISDFTNIDHLKDKEIDVALGVRSTVYLRGEKYVKFMTNMGKKLTDDGLYIDDNVRDNDGWYYRIAELLQVRKQTDPDMQIKIVMGPGLEKEDLLAGKAEVPLAVIMTKDESKITYTKDKLKAAPKVENIGYRLVDIEELAAQPAYLQLLDKTGRVAAMTKEAMKMSNQAA